MDWRLVGCLTLVYTGGCLLLFSVGGQEGKGGGQGSGSLTVHWDHLGSWLKSKFLDPAQKLRFSNKVVLG